MYVNIDSATTTALNTLGNGLGGFHLRITNNQAADQIITLQLKDSSGGLYYIIKSLVMPESTAVMFERIRFDVNEHTFEIVTTGTTNITYNQISL
jgi:hypothetical protein